MNLGQAVVVDPAANDRLTDLDRPREAWTAQELRRAFVQHGCAIVRGAISTDVVDAYRDLVLGVHATEGEPLHVAEAHVRAFTGGQVSLYGVLQDPLFGDTLSSIFRGQTWILDSAISRRIAGVDRDVDWQVPLQLHLDAEFHFLEFTVNCWVPLDDCGVDAPGLQLVPADYLTTRCFSGFTAENRDPNRDYNRGHFDMHLIDEQGAVDWFGPDCFLRPSYRRGDVVLASNWILHGTHRTPGMRRGRVNLELRFRGSTMDIDTTTM